MQVTPERAAEVAAYMEELMDRVMSRPEFDNPQVRADVSRGSEVWWSSPEQRALTNNFTVLELVRHWADLGRRH